MTIKQLGGVFGRNPTFKDVTIEGTFDIESDGVSLKIDAQSSAARITAGSGDKLGLGANDTVDQLLIDNSGQVLVGKTSAGLSNVGVEFRQNGLIFATADGTDPLKLNRLNSDGTILEFRKNTATVGSISVTASATAYNTSSDYRLKEDVQAMSNATDRLKELKPVNFAWKADGSRVDGFLAHEAQKVVPESVTGTKDAMITQEYEVSSAKYDENGIEITEAVMGERKVPDYQGIDQSKLVPLLVATIQELEARITALES